MTKDIEQLLRPRVKVIAPWPEMGRWLAKVGDILADPGGNKTVTNQDGDAVPSFEWEAFPHLFEYLDWWEELSISDLPKYIKPNYERDFMKDDDWVYEANWVMEDSGPFHYIAAGRMIHAHNVLPATHADYINYNKSQPTS